MNNGDKIKETQETVEKEYSKEVHETTKIVCMEQPNKKFSCTLTGQKEVKEWNQEKNEYDYYIPNEPEDWDVDDVEVLDFSGLKTYVKIEADPTYITIDNGNQLIGECVPKEIYNKKTIECR